MNEVIDKPLNILFVGDKPTSLPNKATYLSQEFEIQSCKSINTINDISQDFDAILYDMDMDSTPIQTFQRINKKFNSTPIVVLTTIRGSDSTIDMLQHGAYDYIFKGFSNCNKVLYCVAKVIRKHGNINRLKAISKSFL